MPIDIDELLAILPRLVRENDTVKGAIISALSGVVATHEDILMVIGEMDKRFEKVDQRFEKVDQRFEKMDQKWSTMFREVLWMRKGLASLGNRSGHKTEKIILSFWREILQNRFGVDIDGITELVLLEQVGARKTPVEIQFDMYAPGDPPHLFELKFHPSRDDINNFVAKAAKFEKAKGQVPELVLIGQEIPPAVKRYAENLGIHVLEPDPEPPEVWEIPSEEPN